MSSWFLLTADAGEMGYSKRTLTLTLSPVEPEKLKVRSMPEGHESTN
jgi:hypothetical protein